MEKIASNVWKVAVTSNVYLLDLGEWVVIDTGPYSDRETVEAELSSVVALDKVSKLILTHLHYDHCANFDLFPNAIVYAHEDSIKALQSNKVGAILDPSTAARFDVKLEPLKDMLGLEVIYTPGHTTGIVCLLYKEKKILFSGDTLYNNGMGRVDLPFSDPALMEKSLAALKKIDYDILAPGHDY